jgi:hypothetical protein
LLWVTQIGFFPSPLKDLKEKKEVVEEAENGRDAPANGNAVSVLSTWLYPWQEVLP